jgi:hypothetical protein
MDGVWRAQGHTCVQTGRDGCKGMDLKSGVLIYHVQKQDEPQVDTSQVSRPTPAAIGPKDLYNVKIAAPKGEDA